MILDLLFVILLVAWSGAIGLAILRRLAPVPEHRTDALALIVPLGLGTLAMAALALGEAGALTSLGIGAVLAAGAWIGVRETMLYRSGFSSPPREASPSSGNRWDRLIDRGFDLVLVAGIVGSLLVALKPATDGDALCYHLQVPKIFLAAGAVGFEPDLHETIYPLVTEMLYAVALAIRSPVACRLIQWVFGLVFAASVTALARPTLGRRARWAGTVALLVPAVSNGMGAPLNDVALAAFGNVALLAWVRWHDRPTTGAAILTGILAGLALGVKYPALVWTGLLGLAMLGVAWRDRRDPERGVRTRVLAPALAFGCVVLLVGGVWYLRGYLHTGNPVYPFFKDTFDGAGIDDVLAPAKQPMAVTPWNVVTALVPMTLDPNRFDTVSHQFGPAFLMFLPALIFFRPPQRVAGIVALGWLFLTLCVTQRQSMRFVLTAVGPLAVGVAWLAARWARERIAPARLLVGMLLLVLTFEASIALYRTRHGLDVVLGRESTPNYLARVEPTYLVGRWIEEHLPPGARLIGQDHRGFYLPRHYTMELAHRRRTGLAMHGEPADEIVATLLARGFTHLLMCPPVPEGAVEFDSLLSEALLTWLAGREPIYRRELSDGDGVVRAYAIYDLDHAERPRLAVDDRPERSRRR